MLYFSGKRKTAVPLQWYQLHALSCSTVTRVANVVNEDFYLEYNIAQAALWLNGFCSSSTGSICYVFVVQQIELMEFEHWESYRPTCNQQVADPTSGQSATV